MPLGISLNISVCSKWSLLSHQEAEACLKMLGCSDNVTKWIHKIVYLDKVHKGVNKLSEPILQNLSRLKDRLTHGGLVYKVTRISAASIP